MGLKEGQVGDEPAVADEEDGRLYSDRPLPPVTEEEAEATAVPPPPAEPEPESEPAPEASAESESEGGSGESKQGSLGGQSKRSPGRPRKS